MRRTKDGRPRPSKPENDTQAPTNLRKGLVTGQLEQRTLDHLALLFARVKKSDTPAKHVTATALRKAGTGLEIWIAGDGGPKEEDEEFRLNLQSWFQRKGDWEKDDGLMTSAMKSFWRDRLDHYAHQIITLWKSLCEGPKPDIEEESEIAKERKSRRKLKNASSDSVQMDKDPAGLVKSRNTLTEIFEMGDPQLFDQDWSEAESLCSNPEISLQTLKSADETILLSDIGRQSYETFDNTNQPQSHLDLARDFDKLLKTIRLLGTVAKALEIFAEFREKVVRNGGIKLKFLDPIESLDLGSEACIQIAGTVERWARSASNPEFRKEIRERKGAIEGQREDRRKSHRYFHYELSNVGRISGRRRRLRLLWL